MTNGVYGPNTNLVLQLMNRIVKLTSEEFEALIAQSVEFKVNLFELDSRDSKLRSLIEFKLIEVNRIFIVLDAESDISGLGRSTLGIDRWEKIQDLIHMTASALILKDALTLEDFYLSTEYCRRVFGHSLP